MSKIKLSENFIKNTVKLALNEDLYPSGDITSDLIKNNKVIEAKLISNDKVEINRSLSAERFQAITGYVPPDWPQLIKLMHSYH